MSDLKAELQSALIEAMKAKDSVRRDAIRLLNSAIKQVEVDSRAALDNKGVQAVLQKEAKQARESIAELEAGGHAQQAASAKFNLQLIESFLPRPLSEQEIRQVLHKAIAATGASSPRDMGAVMQAVMPELRGRADGRQVSAMVKELLS